MTNFNPNRFGIFFTVSFVALMLVLINLLSNDFLSNDLIPILLLSASFLAITGYRSYQPIKSKKKIQILTTRTYLIFLVLGIFLGLVIRYAFNIPSDVDFENIEPESIFYLITLAIGGLAGVLFFLAMGMAISILNIPYIKSKLHGETVWTPFISGGTFGFSVMIFLDLYFKGIPKICC